VGSDALAVRDRLVNRYKEGLIDNAAIVISALAVLIAAGALMFAGIAMYAAVDAKVNLMSRIEHLEETNDVTQIYVRDLKAYMIEQGFRPPEEP